MKKIAALIAIGLLSSLTACGGKKTTTSPEAIKPPPPPPSVPSTPVVTPAPTPTPAPDLTPAPAPAANDAKPAAGTKYVVKRGDTLWGIATRTYGDGRQYKKIVAANPAIKGERVNAGQTIVLP